MAKPPQAWNGIAHVERVGVDLDRLQAAAPLFEGPARWLACYSTLAALGSLGSRVRYVT